MQFTDWIKLFDVAWPLLGAVILALLSLRFVTKPELAAAKSETAAIEARVDAVERATQNAPTRQDVQDLEIRIERIAASIEKLKVQVNALASQGEERNRTLIVKVDRIESYLLSERGGKRSAGS